MDAKVKMSFVVATRFGAFISFLLVWVEGDQERKIDVQFWTGGSIDKNNGLVEQLKQYGVIKSNKVAEVMQTIDRALFVPKDAPAYVDSPMPIGYNATISAPHMHATCLELLKDHLQPGMHALDVGSGTGYLTACFALMVGTEGHAVGVEHIPEWKTRMAGACSL